MKIFEPAELKKLYKPKIDSQGEDNGQVTIIGGSDLFHGAPILSMKVASRINDMVFFATPEKSVGMIAESIKSKLMSFIWIPWNDVDKYIEKSDSILIGPGMKRFKREGGGDNHDLDSDGGFTKKVTEKFLKKFPHKKWVIDAGSLQVMLPEWIPENAVLTPNRREFETLFGLKHEQDNVREMAKKYKCVIIAKGADNYICSSNDTVKIPGGNAGLTKGGTGDVLAGLTVALLARNDPFLAASAACYISKFAADSIHKRSGPFYNSDDLTSQIPETLQKLLN